MSGPKSGDTRPRAGFSIIELVMALIVLAFGVVGLATTTLFITRQLTLAEVTTARATAARSVMERIRATPYDLIDSGGDTIGPMVISWTVTAHHAADHDPRDRDSWSGTHVHIRDPVGPHAGSLHRGHASVQGAETMRTGDRGGFTLVELLIVAVLGVVVAGATYQMILTSQIAHTTQTAQIQGQQTVRAGIDILFAELRELSGPEGDILEMNPDRVEVRAMRAFGLVCNVNPVGSPIRVKKIGRYFASGDSIVVFADNDRTLSSDDTILSGAVANITEAETCTDTAQSLVVPELVAALTNDTVRLGAPVRGFTIYTYGLYSLEGDYYLARQSGGVTEPLVGPLSVNGVSFTYMDSGGSVTTNPRAVSQIEVTLRSRSKVTNERGPVGDSLTTTIYLRN